MARTHVETILAHNSVPAALREAVRSNGASASFRPFQDAVRRGVSPGADVVVVVVPDDVQPLVRPLRVLFERLAESPRPVLVLKSGGGLVPRIAHPEVLPVTFGCGLDREELAARLGTMFDLRGSLDCLHRGLLARQREEEAATTRYERQLRLASQVQREFMPEFLPEFGPVSFAVVFRPADYVSGDIYDVHRLDEEHVAITVADATGHGIPAALLTVFVKRALRGKELHADGYRILAPGEVLRRLNAELFEANLSECQFVAAVYGVLNLRTLELTLARGGTPYPILRQADGALRLLRPAGGLVGILPEAEFATETVQLQPGDTLILTSDGLETAIAPHTPAQGLAEAFRRAACAARHAGGRPLHAEDLLDFGEPESADDSGMFVATAASSPHEQLPDGPGSAAVSPAGACAVVDAPSLQGRRAFAADEALLSTSWCATLRDDGPQAALEQLSARHDTLRRMGQRLDDLTVLAVNVRA